MASTDQNIGIPSRWGILNQDIRSVKRKRENYCCIVCKVTSGRSNNLQHLAGRLDNVRIEEDDDDDPCRAVVNLHTCKIQLVMTENAPTDFKLSLDFLPCFQSPVGNNNPFKGGWIAAGSSCGLLLCTSAKFNQSQYYVCNPFTKQWAALPPAPRVHIRVHVGFVVEPCRNEQLQSLCKYQVVRFPHNHLIHERRLRSHYQVETFSSESGEWTIESVSSPKEMEWSADTFSCQSILHNGRLHWLSRGSIVVYDPNAKKLLGVIDRPSRLQACRSFGLEGLSVSGGSLWISQFAGTSLDFRFWQLKGYDSPHIDNLNDCEWKPMYKFNVSDLSGGPDQWGPKPGGCCILGMHPHNPKIVYLKLRRSTRSGGGCYLVDCNLRTRTMGQERVWNSTFQNWGDIVTLARV